MKSLIENPKPGDFRAVCKKGAVLPFATLTDEQRARAVTRSYGPGKSEIETRWDKKLRAEVATVVCDFETTDRVEFERHMAELHGRKPRHSRPFGGDSRWRAPRLSEEGQPFKDRDGRTQTCSTCGLVDEIPLNHAGDLWWREHIEGCALANEQVAS